MKQIVGHTVGHFLKAFGFLAVFVSLVCGGLLIGSNGQGFSIGILGSILGLLTYGIGELINIAYDIHQMMRSKRTMRDEDSSKPEGKAF